MEYKIIEKWHLYSPGYSDQQKNPTICEMSHPHIKAFCKTLDIETIFSTFDRVLIESPKFHIEHLYYIEKQQKIFVKSFDRVLISGSCRGVYDNDRNLLQNPHKRDDCEDCNFSCISLLQNPHKRDDFIPLNGYFQEFCKRFV